MSANLLEVAMLLSFGAAWPVSIAKSLKSRAASGKSVVFLFIIAFGYLCGIAAKFVGGTVNYILIFYLINLLAVLFDAGLYYRNRRLDARRAGGEQVP